MSNDWSLVPFSSVLAEPVRNGIYKPKDFHGRGAKIVNMGELFGHPRLRDVPMKRVELNESELKRFSLSSGDLIFARRSLVAEGAGKCSIVLEVNEHTTFESSIIRGRPDRRKADPLFLYYFFSSPIGFQALDTIRRQVAVAGITGSDLSELLIPKPPLAEQNAIASVLSALDDKIELNRQMNETLEALAQAIFKDWFVTFGPTRRKLEGATDPVAILGGLIQDAPAEVGTGSASGASIQNAPAKAAPLAALFPDSFGENGLPEGWEEGTLGDLAESVGSVVQPASIAPSTPYIGLEHMPRKSIALGECGIADSVTSAKAAFVKGQILFGKLRPYFHKVGLAPLDGVASTDIVVMDAKDTNDRALIATIVSTEAFVNYTDLGSDGTKMPRTSWAKMKAYPISIADRPVLRSFGEIVQPLHDKIVSSIGENRTLAETRDYLLPKLMSGAVRVRDVEKAVL